MNASGLTKSKRTRSKKSGLVAGKQPLNIKAALMRRVVLLGLFILGLTVLAVQNSEVIGERMGQPITKVHMENQSQSVAETEVRQILEQFMGSGFFEFDVAGVKRELETHPWIRNAAVKKQWPDSLVLNLAEEVAIARWGDRELINQYGEIFQPDKIVSLGLPQLWGPPDSQLLVMEQYRTINQLFFPAGLRVTELHLSQRGNWGLQLNDQIEVTAGRTDVMEKLTRFLRFYNQQSIESSQAIAAVDLRYNNGIAVKTIAEELSSVAAR